MPPAEPAPDCWLHADLAPGRSEIAGTGLFTRVPIPAGTVVSRLGGRLVHAADLSSPVAHVVAEDAFLVLPPDALNRLVNHSCDPNLWWLDEYTLAARHDIAAGAELSSDYATSNNHPDFFMGCHCGTYRCRQLIAGDDWRISQLQQRYAGRWVPYLQALINSDL